MVGVGGSNPLATTIYGRRVCATLRWFDKIAWSDFGRPQDGPKGDGQDVRRNPLATTNTSCGLW